MRKIIVFPIRIYQRVISPVLPHRCRFHPTCSEYAISAILRYGLVRGGWLSLRRLLRCGPWDPGGYDPLP
ncbi:MAG: membrane protein insertion efficiency factor YidD [Candidatus Bipolaricaulota bacterium]|nr:membrane protein insertion efficiency factor YidD [Candidatus Bipolaricaulota bacterium]